MELHDRAAVGDGLATLTPRRSVQCFTLYSMFTFYHFSTAKSLHFNYFYSININIFLSRSIYNYVLITFILYSLPTIPEANLYWCGDSIMERICHKTICFLILIPTTLIYVQIWEDRNQNLKTKLSSIKRVCIYTLV